MRLTKLLQLILDSTTCTFLFFFFFFLQETSNYRISVGIPKGCEKKSISKCDYFLGINTNSENSFFVDFTLEANAKGWVAVGFSDTPSMVHT